ncbi:hypothetical protein oki272_00370 [Helicobacter pylori]|uniref:hypothetical protein n=1 Tax=Helicobacter pylori TaxID=210 RepID=UPI0009584FE2|nr:hypothetical protein [Helicobacter pylori]BAW40347.1 m-protein [Helicobacter pylori]GHQ82297.1 hypothetical protein JP0078_09840 [Helicobacter pylori]
MNGAHSVENTNTEKNMNISNTTASTPPNNEEPLNNDLKDLTDRFKKLEDKLEDLEPLIKISRFIGSFLENPLTTPKKIQKTLKEKRKRLKELKKKSTN